MSGGQGGLILEYSKFWMKSLGTFEVITAVYLAGSADCRKVTKYLYHNKQTKSTKEVIWQVSQDALLVVKVTEQR